MIRRLVVTIALLAVGFTLGASVISNTAWRKRQQARAILDDRTDEYVARSRRVRFVDIGVELRVVIADPNGEELISGKPKLRILQATQHGGWLDTRSKPPRLVAASTSPRIWYCSQDQHTALVHGDELPLGLLIYGSEGAGKTELMPMWHYFRWLEHLGEGREGGQTAPTKRRLKMFRDAFFRIFPKAWYRHRKSIDQLVLCDGTRIQLVSTHQQSKDAGSPIQGFNWSWCGSDEFQDSYDRATDIEARGRSAKNGHYKQARPCTAKDTTAWREFKDQLLTAVDAATARPLWALLKLMGRDSPFVEASFWDSLKAKYSPREYARRVEPLDDLPPELAVYYCWLRTRNLVTLPRIATDVTPAILSGYRSYQCTSSRFTLLGCHDPGNIINVTEVLRLVMFGDVPTWMVVGELKTEQTTADAHARQFREYVWKTFGVEGRIRDELNPQLLRCDPDTSKIAVFIDPHGKGEAQTDYQTVYGAFQSHGFDAFSPAAITGKIKRRARVEMVNRLLGNAAGIARLVVAKNERGETLAPVLVDALESLVKQPGDDDPEGTRRKDVKDKTHAPAALGYGLWPFEQEQLTQVTIKAARDAARRLRV